MFDLSNSNLTQFNILNSNQHNSAYQINSIQFKLTQFNLSNSNSTQFKLNSIQLIKLKSTQLKSL